MTDNQTTLLSDRLHRLADDMTPPVDVVGQVREARERHRRRRRGQFALAAVATATAALVVGTTVVIGQLSVAVELGEVAVPSQSVPTTTEPAPTTPTATTPSVAPAPQSEPAATWPADAADLRTGGTFYVVFVAMAPEDDWGSLPPLAEELYALGYSASTGDACAAPVDGSELPFDWSVAPMFVSVHFDTEQAAQQFVATYEEEFSRQVVGIFHVWPFCL